MIAHWGGRGQNNNNSNNDHDDGDQTSDHKEFGMSVSRLSASGSATKAQRNPDIRPSEKEENDLIESGVTSIGAATFYHRDSSAIVFFVFLFFVEVLKS